jgi:NADH:ubiquinone oxidoreductase subunit K
MLIISKVYALMNLGLGVLCVWALVQALSEGKGLLEGSGVFLVSGLLFFMGCAGFAIRSRWVVIMAALPLLLLLGAFTTAIAAGGWIWGTGHAATVYSLILFGAAVFAFELSGIFVIRKIDPPGYK